MGLLAYALGYAIPRLETRFAFRDMFAPGHPARDAYDEFERAFGRGAQIQLFFHGKAAFSGPFLAGLNELSQDLRRLDGTRSVFSLVDLVEPRTTPTHQQLSRILREEVLEDPARLAARLGAPPFTDHFIGSLYDREKATVALTVTPPKDDRDPRASASYLAAVLEPAAALAARHGLELYPGGYRFVHLELRRIGMESQARLGALAAPLLVLLFLALFGSLRVAAQVFVLLATSIALAFAGMQLVGLPVTFMSLNLALMVLVIGTADLVHMIGSYASHRRRYGPRGAALRAAKKTATPVFLTSAVTAVCLVVTAATPLEQVREFSLALALGVMVSWAVAVVFGPLFLMRSGVMPGRGLYFRIHDGLDHALAGSGERISDRTWIPVLFAVLTGAGFALAAGQTVDSNWFRLFGPGTPVARTLAFLPAHGFPVSPVDCTVEVETNLLDSLADPGLARDLAKLEAVLRRQPGVLGVDHVLDKYAVIRDQLAAMEFPAGLAPEWREARRQAMLRDYLAGGVFDPYFSPTRRRLRIVALTSLESSRDLLGLAGRVEAEVGKLAFERIRPGTFTLTGQMLFWSAIATEIPRTFLMNMAADLVVVLLFFLLMTRSLTLALIAIPPNVFPVLVMPGVAYLAGITINENACFMVSIVLGIAVDDTLHSLYHYVKALDRGLAPPAAVREALGTSGASNVGTSLLLIVGFGVALASPMAPIRQIGILLPTAFAAALAAELLLFPWLLLRFAAREA